MEKTYLFDKGNGRFIVNDERSKIGYSYPRVFVEGKQGEFINLDLTLGEAFKMSKKDFESWIDGSEVRNADLSKLCENLGINHDALMEVVSSFQK